MWSKTPKRTALARAFVRRDRDACCLLPDREGHAVVDHVVELVQRALHAVEHEPRHGGVDVELVGEVRRDADVLREQREREAGREPPREDLGRRSDLRREVAARSRR